MYKEFRCHLLLEAQCKNYTYSSDTINPSTSRSAPWRIEFIKSRNKISNDIKK